MDRRLSSNLLQFCQFVDSDPFLGANSADAPIASRQSACVTDVLGSLTAGRGLPVGSSSPRAWGLAASDAMHDDHLCDAIRIASHLG